MSLEEQSMFRPKRKQTLLVAGSLGVPLWLRLPAGAIAYLAVMAPLVLGLGLGRDLPTMAASEH